MSGKAPDTPEARRAHDVRRVDDETSVPRPTIHELRSRGEPGLDVHDPRPHDHDPRPHDHDPRPHAHDPASHAHENAHAHDPTPPEGGGGFPHEKLDAYRVALQMAELAKRLGDSIPRGHRNVADHVLRAATNAVLLLAEGANRRGAGEKRQRFVESRGECGEAAAGADLVLVLGIGSAPDAEALKHLASRVSAMLTRLIARLP
jgi:four helix bundle protein